MQRASPAMDTTLYEDVHMSCSTLKTSSSPPPHPPSPPNVNRINDNKVHLHLASPHLEEFTFQSHASIDGDGFPSMAISTPTMVLFPRSVTEEQEEYARGFVEALSNIHKNQGPVTGEAPPINNDVKHAPSVAPARPMTYTTLTTLSRTSRGAATFPSRLISSNTIRTPSNHPMFSQSGGSACVELPSHSPYHHTQDSMCVDLGNTHSPYPLAGGSMSVDSHSHIPYHAAGDEDRTRQDSWMGNSLSFAGSRVTQLKEEPQTVPCLGITPPLSPLHTSVPLEHIQVERKRERNREAARKCRNKKLEQISRLETRVKELMQQNGRLGETASALREQLGGLRQEISDHRRHGCQLIYDSQTSSIPLISSSSKQLMSARQGNLSSQSLVSQSTSSPFSPSCSQPRRRAEIHCDRYQ